MQAADPKQTYSLKWLFLGGGAAVIGVAAMLVAGGANSTGQNADDVRAAIAPIVETAIVTPAKSSYTITAPGRLRALHNISVVGEVAGKITYISPKLVLGGRFDAGETLLEINKIDFEVEVARAEAGLASAKATYTQAEADKKRRLELFARGASTEAARDQAVAGFETAVASLKQAEVQLRLAKENFARATVTAPFPALVTAKTASVGGYVAPGQELARLIDARSAELVAGLSPRDAEALSYAISQSNGLGVDALAKPNDGSVGTAVLHGKIERFSPVVDATSRSALVVAVFSDAFVASNQGQVFADDFMTLEVSVKAKYEQVWHVPYGALRRDEYIWLINAQGELTKQIVTVLDSNNGIAMIASERDISDAKVLLTALSEEKNGLKVNPVSTEREIE
jgi:RND family efflux transporter MFP subunit